MKPLFITAIGTDIGKTIISAILVEKLKADYWKPVQAGDLEKSDTITVQKLISNPVTKFHPETYRLTQPFSPHKSAALDKLIIDQNKFRLPGTSNNLIIEGAGGLMVPLNEIYFIVDLIKSLDAEVILVSKNYLGSINHTLLSVEVLRARGIPIKGIVFNGAQDEYSEDVICKYSKVDYFANIPQQQEINKTSISLLGDCFNNWEF